MESVSPAPEVCISVPSNSETNLFLRVYKAAKGNLLTGFIIPSVAYNAVLCPNRHESYTLSLRLNAFDLKC